MLARVFNLSLMISHSLMRVIKKPATSFVFWQELLLRHYYQIKSTSFEPNSLLAGIGHYKKEIRIPIEVPLLGKQSRDVDRHVVYR